MWCFVNHTKRHVVATDLFDIGRSLKALVDYSTWSFADHIDIEDIDPKAPRYQEYTYDV